jgi:hypothetical protein
MRTARNAHGEGIGQVDPGRDVARNVARKIPAQAVGVK